MKFTMAMIIIVTALLCLFLGKIGYIIGYEKGSFHTVLHLQATGYLPSKAWRRTHRNDDIQTPEQLLSLSPEITFTSGDPCVRLGRK